MAGTDEWYYFGRDNAQRGPVSAEALSRLYDANDVHDDTYVWCEGACETWTPLAQASLRYVPVQYAELQGAPAGPDLD